MTNLFPKKEKKELRTVDKDEWINFLGKYGNRMLEVRIGKVNHDLMLQSVADKFGATCLFDYGLSEGKEKILLFDNDISMTEFAVYKGKIVTFTPLFLKYTIGTLDHQSNGDEKIMKVPRKIAERYGCTPQKTGYLTDFMDEDISNSIDVLARRAASIASEINAPIASVSQILVNNYKTIFYTHFYDTKKVN